MNTMTRGIRNAFRNVIRTGSIVLILALSIGLIIAMLAARQAVSDKIETVKSSSGNTITVSPAGARGFEGGGTALTADQLSKVAAVSHVTKVVNSLNDRLTSTNTNLASAIEAGQLGQRNANTTGVSTEQPPIEFSSSSSSTAATRSFTPPVTVTGVSDASAIGSGSGTITWKSGAAFDGSSTENIAVLGSAIAEKNSLAVGSTFTAYDTTVKVVGIYTTSNTFGNNGVYMPLATLQTLSDQAGSITSSTVTIDTSDNLATATSAVKTALGSSADVTNSQDIADATTKPLESVKQIALFNLIGAIVAGAVIVLLTMLMIVRERRREIGVMKALGSSNLKIMWQFVVESLTLTTMALIIGTGIGIAAATPLTNALVDNSSSSTTTTTITTPQRGEPGGFRGFGQASANVVNNIQTSVGIATLATGVGATLLIAVLGSAVPSFMISKIKPADAMRNE
ncbi:MAG: FtsX-like permease family protein [Candidatus Saccharimonas sp.]